MGGDLNPVYPFISHAVHRITPWCSTHDSKDWDSVQCAYIVGRSFDRQTIVQYVKEHLDTMLSMSTIWCLNHPKRSDLACAVGLTAVVDSREGANPALLCICLPPQPIPTSLSLSSPRVGVGIGRQRSPSTPL
jgi:hypothetical protein